MLLDVRKDTSLCTDLRVELIVATRTQLMLLFMKLKQTSNSTMFLW